MSVARRVQRVGRKSRTPLPAHSALIGRSGVAIALTAAGLYSPVWAQVPGNQGTGAGMDRSGATPALEEIVVTAEKRESSVQSVPISIAAISGADLQEQGITDFSAFAQQVPGISMRTSGPGQTEFEMRGMTSSGGQSPTVGFYLDETPLTPPATAQNGKVAIDPNLYDLSRVEILRGPQGTLYGAGSMGGTIKLVTNKPDLRTFAASAEASGSGTHTGSWSYGANAMLNLPLVADKAALRLVGTSQYTSGWINRLVVSPFPLETGHSPACAVNGFYGCVRGNLSNPSVQADYKDVNVERLDGARATLLVTPFDRLSVTASGFYQRLTLGAPGTYDSSPGTLAHYQPFDVAEPFEDEFTVSSLVARYRFDFADLTSATSYWTRKQVQTQDDSEVLQDSFGLPAFDIAAGGVGPSSITETDTSEQFSEELRLSSASTDPFQWLVGAFYSHFHSTTSSYSNVPGLLTLFGGGVFSTSDFITVFRPSVVNQRAGFGEASYDLTEKLRLTAGLRYYSYSTEILSTETGIVSPSGGTTPTTSVGSASATGSNPKLTLSSKAFDDVLLYATAAKGFRPGAGNMPVPVSGADSCESSLAALDKTQAPLQYDPDTVWSYELGEKATLLDHRLTLDGDVFFERWNGVQQHVVLGCGFNYTDNAGDAQVYGGELEVQAQLTPAFQLIQTGGYTHAALSKVTPETGGSVGQRLEDVPNWTASTSLIYKRPVSARYDFVARAQYNYVGPMEDLTYGRNDVPGYSIANFRLGLAADAYSVNLFVNNLADARANLGNTVSYSVNLPTYNRVATNQPRTIGLDLQFRF